MSRVIDQDLLFNPLTKRNVQKFTDLNIEKHMLHSRNYCQVLRRKHYNLHSLVAKRYLKWKKLYNSHNYVVYVLKKMRCLRINQKRYDNFIEWVIFCSLLYIYLTVRKIYHFNYRIGLPINNFICSNRLCKSTTK